jgi:hypothetical protein
MSDIHLLNNFTLRTVGFSVSVPRHRHRPCLHHLLQPNSQHWPVNHETNYYNSAKELN